MEDAGLTVLPPENRNLTSVASGGETGGLGTSSSPVCRAQGWVAWGDQDRLQVSPPAPHWPAQRIGPGRAMGSRDEGTVQTAGTLL